MKIILLFFILVLSLSTFAVTLTEILEKNGGKLPVPFKKLIEATEGSKEDVVLIPKGRSLVKDKVSFEDPRIILNSNKTENPSPLIIGYSPSTDSLEITSWNPVTKKYDFLEVENYSVPKNQKLIKEHNGKCITCHTNSGLLFTPAPWGELLDFGNRVDDNGKDKERRIPTQIYETAKKNGELEKWRSEYGIDLEEYKIDSSERVLQFFNKVSQSSSQINSNEICKEICQGVDAKECRKTMLKFFIERAVFIPENRSALVSESAINLANKELEKLKGKRVNVNDFLIPDFNPETGYYYEPARTESELQKVAEISRKINMDFTRDYEKKFPPPPFPPKGTSENDPRMIAMNEYESKKLIAFQRHTVDGETSFVASSRIKVSPEEARKRYGTKGFEDRVVDKEIDNSSLISAILNGRCFNLNIEQIDELKKNFSAGEIEKLIENGSLDEFLTSQEWLDDKKLMAKLLSFKGKETQVLSSAEKYCLHPIENYLEQVAILEGQTDKIQLYVLRDIFKEINKETRVKKAFEFYCMECHGANGDEIKLDLNDLSKLRAHEDGEVLGRLKRNKMPPKESPQFQKYWVPVTEGQTQLEAADIIEVEKLRNEMIEAMKK